MDAFVKGTLVIALAILMLVPKLIHPHIANAQETATVRVFILLDEDGDGEGDLGTGAGTEVELFGPLGTNEGRTKTELTNEVSEARFEEVPYGNYFVSAHPVTRFFTWDCLEGKIVDESLEYVLMDCKRAKFRFFGIYIPLAFTAPHVEAADTREHKLYLPNLANDQ